MHGNSFGLTVGGITLVVWAVVVFDHLRSEPRTRTHRVDATSVDAARSWATVNWIICLAWAFAVIPTLIGLFQVGRLGNADIAPLATTQLQTYLATLLSTVLLLLCFRLIVMHFHDAPASSIWHLAAFLAPWLAIQLIGGVAAGYLSGRQFVFYPIVAIALWLASPPLRVVRTVGVLACLTAGFSILFAIISPLGLVNAGPAALMKAIIGHGPFLLAGPYGSPNQLALSLALGAPCTLMFRSRAAQAIGLSLIGVALAWAAGRTSILAATVGVVVYVLCRGRSVRTKRVIASIAMSVGALLLILTPFYDQHPQAFSSRGIIWIQSLASWHDHFWLGGGPLYYERSDLTYYLLSVKILHGHNLMVDALARGGLVGLAGVAAWLYVLAQRSLRLASVSTFPIVFVVTLVFVSWLEVPLNLSNLGHLGYVCWLPAAIVCFARDDYLSETDDPSPAVASPA